MSFPSRRESIFIYVSPFDFLEYEGPCPLRMTFYGRTAKGFCPTFLESIFSLHVTMVHRITAIPPWPINGPRTCEYAWVRFVIFNIFFLSSLPFSLSTAPFDPGFARDQGGRLRMTVEMASFCHILLFGYQDV